MLQDARLEIDDLKSQKDFVSPRALISPVDSRTLSLARVAS